MNAVDPWGLNADVIRWAPPLILTFPEATPAILFCAGVCAMANSDGDGLIDGKDWDEFGPKDETCKEEPPESDKCKRLAKKIANLRKEVYEKRIPDLENNPGNLPERIGPGEKLRDTVRGHRKLLNRQWRRLNELEDRYAKECGNK